MTSPMIEEMRREATGLATIYVNSTPELWKKFVAIREKRYNAKTSFNKAQDLAEDWARDHDDEFGALFLDELPLVRWNAVMRDI